MKTNKVSKGRNRQKVQSPKKLFMKSLREFSDDFFADGRKQPAMQKRDILIRAE